MCGVFFSNSSSISVNLESLKHRGPDEVTLIKESNFQYGFCRLAIRDLSSAHQPRVKEDYVSAINGELYNEEEIRNLIAELDPKAELPIGDMNILGLYLYLTDGLGIETARGMFAGYVHFLGAHKIVYFRDAIGEKPLFQFKLNGYFALSSESRFADILSLSISRRELNTFDLIRGHSIWKTEEVTECAAGTLYTMDLETLSLHSFRYYSWPKRPLYRGEGSLERLENAIVSAINRQSTSDVPMSLLLSGGLDSSLIAFFAKQNGIDLSAFTLTMNSHDWNESSIASLYAKDLGFKHTEINYSDKEVASLIPSILHAMDVPILDSACISMYLATKKVSETHKVSFSGDGGDEISRGYEIYRWLPYLRFSRCLTFFSSGLAPRFEIRTNSTKYNSPGMKINRARDVLSNNNFSISEIALSPFGGTPLFRDLARKYSESHQFECTEEYYSGKILPRVYLTKSDRMSMANSVEVRSPFLDLEVIREGMKFSKVELSYRNRKWILRELAKRHLPDYILKNQKHGFSPPLGSILKHVTEPNWSPEIRNLTQVSPSYIWRNAREDQNYSIAAWALLVLDHFIKKGNLVLLK